MNAKAPWFGRSTHRVTPGRWVAITALAIVAPLDPGGCAPSKVDASVADVAPTGAPLGSVRQLPVTRIPLPPGNWVELARGIIPFRMITADRSTGTDKVQVAYGLIENGQIAAFLVISSNNVTQPNTNWELGDFCTVLSERADKSVFLQKVDSVEVNRASCLKVRYSTLSAPKAANVYADAWNAARRYGGLPHDAIDVGFEAAFNGNVMDYRIYYFPERDGLPPGRWVSGDLDPARATYVRSLVGWALGFQHWVIDGTKNKL